MTPEERFEQEKRLVYYVTKRMKNVYSSDRTLIELDDMIQIGMIGLWKACEKFDEKRELKFSTYAVPKIKGEILTEIREITSGSIKISRQAKIIYKKILKRIDNGEERPTIEKIMEDYNCNRYFAKSALELLSIMVLNIDMPISQGDGSETNFNEVIKDESIDFENDLIKNEELKERLSLVDDRSRDIIYLMLKGKTQAQIGKIVGLSQVHVSRIYKNALKIIHKNYEVNADENESQLIKAAN